MHRRFQRLILAAACGLGLAVWAGSICEAAATFIRGDSNADGALDISDPVKALIYLFLGDAESPPCADAADTDDSGAVDISDPISTLEFLFLGRASIAAPYPGCGPDPTPDDLGCASFPPCPPLNENLPPAASFTADPLQGEAPLTVHFDASSSSDPDGVIASFGWNFGDQQAASGTPVSHTYDIAGSYLVTLTVIDDKGAPAEALRPIQVDPAQPAGEGTSFQLLDKALESGEISAEQAILYRIFAAFEDERLPARFRGSPPSPDHPPVDGHLAAAAAELDTLSPETQATLEPYFLPPSAPGSWLELRQGQAGQAGGGGGAGGAVQWETRLSPSGRVKVWSRSRFPGDGPLADELAAEVDGIWNCLVGLMGADRAPLSDENVGGRPNGGGGELDVYLVPLAPTVGGEEHSYFKCRKSPAYILINSRLTLCAYEHLAHELMHAVLDTFSPIAGCVYGADFRWLNEATAAWAQDYVYPERDCEHGFAKKFLERPELPLNSTVDNRHYGAYLWLFYLSHYTGAGNPAANGCAAGQADPQVVRRIWGATETLPATTSLGAIQDSIAGGFEKRYPEFLLYNWNRADPLLKYKEWDGLLHKARTTPRYHIPVGGEVEIELDEEVPPVGKSVPSLGAVYYSLLFSSEEDRAVAFHQGVLGGGIPSVQAIYKIGGEWKTADWTEKAHVTFCRDKADERLEELIIVVSNLAWESPGASGLLSWDKPPRVTITNIGCWRWRGSVSGSMELSVPDLKVRESMAANVVFVTNESTPFDPSLGSDFELAPGGLSVNWTHSGQQDDANCSCSGTKSGQMSPNLVIGALVIDNPWDVNRRDYGGGISIFSGLETTAMTPYQCVGEDCEDKEVPFVFPHLLSTLPPDQPIQVSADGILKGQASEPETKSHWTWELRPVRE